MRHLIVGLVLSLLGLGGYVVGLFVAFPGRSFSLSGVMIGLTLLSIGRSTGGTVVIEALVYDGTGVESYDDHGAARAAAGTTWVHVSEAMTAEIDTVAEAFDLHALAVEDVRNDVRPKVEEFSAFLFALVKTARLTGGGETTFEE